MNAPDKKAHRDGVPRTADENRPVAAVTDRLDPDRSVGSPARPGQGDGSRPLVEGDDNIEMVAPSVQEQTGSER